MKLSDYTHDLEGQTLFVTFNNRPQHWQQHEYIIVGSQAIHIGARNYWCSVLGSFEQQTIALARDIEVRDGALYISDTYAGDLPSSSVLKSEHTCQEWKFWTVAYSVPGKIIEENVGFKGRKAAIEYAMAFDLVDKVDIKFISCTARNLA
tara:strand:- start:4863 stop:5312 length:450 start_codon:yes stop_codon:yes gene_type:complete